MNIKKHIPNLITLLNLFSGCIALVYASQSDFLMAFFFVALGIFFDFFDGFFARLFKVSSPLGLQLDSLADMVTSGVVPGFVVFKMLEKVCFSQGLDTWIPFLGFLITLGSCYRLANFNIDTRQTDSFIGLPTPANALFFLSLPLVKSSTEMSWLISALENPWILIALSCLSFYILNAELPLFSLKMKKIDVSGNPFPFILILSAIVLILFCKWLALPIIIIWYIVLSVFKNLKSNNL